MVSTNDEIVNAETVQQQTASEVISEEDFDKAQKIFQQGKKNLFLNKFDESVNNFADACKIFTAKYGEFDARCADVYYFYGRALLELARVENTVLGNALNGVPEDTEPINDSRYGNPEDLAAEEKNEISEKVIDALCSTEETAQTVTNGNANEAAAATTTAETAAANNGETAIAIAAPAVVAVIENKAAEEKMEAESSAPAATESKEAGAAAAAVTENNEENGGKEGEEEEEGGDEEEDDDKDLTKNDEQAKDEAEAEEISSLQRSWEMFELAKLVYTKNTECEDQTFRNKRIAECLLKLGEISIEQEIYDQAITDITECIRLQESESAERRDERMLAESFYQLGLAQQFNNQFIEANETYQKSINIMQLRIEKLRAKIEACIDADADAKLEYTKEIADLEALLPEMSSKLEEVNEQGLQVLAQIKEAKELMTSSVVASLADGGENGNGDVKDITSLVKSKRKISEASSNVDADVSIKKTRLSGGGAGDIAAAAVINENQVIANGTIPESTSSVDMVEEKVIETTPAAAESVIVPQEQQTEIVQASAAPVIEANNTEQQQGDGLIAAAVVEPQSTAAE